MQGQRGFKYCRVLLLFPGNNRGESKRLRCFEPFNEAGLKITGDVKIVSDRAGLMLLFYLWDDKYQSTECRQLRNILLIWVQQLNLWWANVKSNLWRHIMLLVVKIKVTMGLSFSNYWLIQTNVYPNFTALDSCLNLAAAISKESFSLMMFTQWCCEFHHHVAVEARRERALSNRTRRKTCSGIKTSPDHVC